MLYTLLTRKTSTLYIEKVQFTGQEKFLVKKTALFLIIILFAACSEKKTTIKGTARGLKNAVVEISGHDKLWGANVVDGKFEFSANIGKPDFFDLKILFSGEPAKTAWHQIYLDRDEYQVTIDQSNVMKYPLIKTQVQAQNDLSEFYVRGPSLEAFIESHPKSLTSAYLLSRVGERIIKEPRRYEALHAGLSNDVKKTSYGKEVKTLIEARIRTMPGAVMPDIKGLTPEGKPFMKDALKGKITLVVFWASWARGSQEDFLSLKQLHDRYHSKGFEILAIAVDKYEGRWKKAIAYNQLNWLHAADFKGAYSENLEAFGTNKLPSYFMVGPDLKFVDDNIAIAGVEAYINDYLRALPTK